MAFDQTTRNRLQRFVNDARRVLEQEFTRQLQKDFGLDPNAGTVAELASLRHINDAQRESARILRDTLAHYRAGDDMDAKQGLDRIVREQAFTVLNRLAALRMAEARGLLVESVGNGFQAKGFQLYARLAGTALGEAADAYRTYLFSVFDELSKDLPGLFDRYSPQGRLFPREAALLQVLNLINDADISPLWSEDETIGWIYQYFNSKEERKAMRDASQAPRNSRELAVRNQFFTPRYVVEFLVDNTLGRLWFNATGGATGLRERCQYLLVKTGETPQVATKLRDPRTLKLLDPACGSMHFGLYAFDLFVEIYRDAWAWEQQHGPGSLDVSTQPQAALKPMSQTYEGDAAFLRDVPRLIIEHNIYGVDIDPRAAQIASLALWLRAQRAWHEAGVKAKERPLIGRGHVVAAIAPPAERELRQQFAANLDQRDAQLFEKTLQLLKGLPELGVLLQVERELPHLIRQVYVGKGTGLFAMQEQEDWQQAEARLRTALTEFAQEVKSTYQGRLFAQDALQGLRLVDLCRRDFDVVVMNPPFGQPASSHKIYLKGAYPRSWKDLYATFIDRGLDLLREAGYLGAITSSTYLNLATFEDLRARLIQEADLESIVELGNGVMDDAAVSAACICIGAHAQKVTGGPSRFIDIKLPTNKEGVLRQASSNYRANKSDVHSFLVEPSKFQSMPNSVFSYWVPETLYKVFSDNRPISEFCRISVGLHTRGNEDRFYRRWWEPRISDAFASNWPHIKTGGNPQHFLKNDHVVVNWKETCSELKAIAESATGGTFTGHEMYFKSGISYIYTGQTTFSAQLMQKGGVFSIAAHGVIANDETDTLWLLSYLNSEPVRLLLKVINPNRFFQANYVKLLPVPRLTDFAKNRLKAISRESLETALQHVSGDECSRYFIKHWSLDFAAERDPFKAVVKHAEMLARSMGALKGEADEIVQSSFRMSKEDMKVLQKRVGASTAQKLPGDALILKEREPYVAASLVSVLVGSAFGRWLSAADPITLRNISGIDLGSPPLVSEALRRDAGDRAGVLSGDPDGERALVSQIHRALTRSFGSNSENVEEAILGYLGLEDLHTYVNLQSRFFEDHLRKYTEGGAAAPIYWPLSTATGSYTLWVYYPSLTSQTLYTVINDFIEPRLRQVGADATALRNKGSARSRDDEKQLEALQSLELELIELRDTLLKRAPTYKPNLDDGVQITAAPLWPLFRHKPWQKVLKETWDKLEKGDFDWAHLAMNYWPERVREKCKTDKSLAIAHGLGDRYSEPKAKQKKARGESKAEGDE